VELCCCVDGEPNSIKSIKNPVASFFNMLHAFTSGSRMNQESLTADDSLSIIGALLQKVSAVPYSSFMPHLSFCVINCDNYC